MLEHVLNAFGLVFLAELGDKSQIVCMTLAARYGARPVVAGAVAAFALLNAVGVLVGAAVGAYVPTSVVDALVIVLFAVFGFKALAQADEEDDEEVDPNDHRKPFALAFTMTFFSELGDKTQIAVAGLAATQSAVGTWTGATLALASTSVLGAVAGRALLTKVPEVWVKRASGVVFLAFAAVKAWPHLSAG